MWQCLGCYRTDQPQVQVVQQYAQRVRHRPHFHPTAYDPRQIGAVCRQDYQKHQVESQLCQTHRGTAQNRVKRTLHHS